LLNHATWDDFDWDNLPDEWPARSKSGITMEYAKRIGAVSLFAIYRVAVTHDE
jgi:hypothetical protein